MSKIEFTSATAHSIFGGWARKCRVDGVDYHVAVKRGKSVIIPYKPRGKNRGWQWSATVYQNGHCVWSGRVPGSIGVRGILIDAGIVS